MCLQHVVMCVDMPRLLFFTQLTVSVNVKRTDLITHTHSATFSVSASQPLTPKNGICIYSVTFEMVQLFFWIRPITYNNKKRKTVLSRRVQKLLMTAVQMLCCAGGTWRLSNMKTGVKWFHLTKIHWEQMKTETPPKTGFFNNHKKAVFLPVNSSSYHTV